MEDSSWLWYGEWVVYDPGYGMPEIGRVADRVPPDGGTAHVCFDCGCTAAATPVAFLSRATVADVARAESRLSATPDSAIWFHRFDDGCPRADPYACRGCVHCTEAA